MRGVESFHPSGLSMPFCFVTINISRLWRERTLLDPSLLTSDPCGERALVFNPLNISPLHQLSRLSLSTISPIRDCNETREAPITGAGCWRFSMSDGDSSDRMLAFYG